MVAEDHDENVTQDQKRDIVSSELMRVPVESLDVIGDAKNQVRHGRMS